MPFGTALSVHPVSSQATGEVIGALLEAVGPDADLVVVLATPGHRGALEDIAATFRHLLSPVVLLAAVTTGLGTGEDYVERGPGLAAWSGTCGPVAAVRPGAGALLGAAGLLGTPGPLGTAAWSGRRAAAPPRFEVAGALVLGGGRPGRSARDGSGPNGATGPRGGAGRGVVAGAVDGPVIVDGDEPGPGPVGVAFGRESGFGATEAHGLRAVGPEMDVTRADGAMVYELDGRPAMRRLIDVARDGMPATEMATLAERLHLQVTSADPAPDAPRPRGPSALRPAPGIPTPVLGVDRANGALAVRDPIDAGSTVRFTITDPATVRAAIGRSIGAGPEGAVILSPIGGGHLLGSPSAAPDDEVVNLDDPAGDGFEDPGRRWPSATLVCETVLAPGAPPGRSVSTLTTVQVAYFQ